MTNETKPAKRKQITIISIIIALILLTVTGALMYAHKHQETVDCESANKQISALAAQSIDKDMNVADVEKHGANQADKKAWDEYKRLRYDYNPQQVDCKTNASKALTRAAVLKDQHEKILMLASVMTKANDKQAYDQQVEQGKQVLAAARDAYDKSVGKVADEHTRVMLEDSIKRLDGFVTVPPKNIDELVGARQEVLRATDRMFASVKQAEFNQQQAALAAQQAQQAARQRVPVPRAQQYYQQAKPQYQQYQQPRRTYSQPQAQRQQYYQQYKPAAKQAAPRLSTAELEAMLAAEAHPATPLQSCYVFGSGCDKLTDADIAQHDRDLAEYNRTHPHP